MQTTARAVERTVASHAPRGHECLCGNLRMAARAVSSAYDRHLRPAGMQASQLAVLWAVAALPDASVKDIAATIAMHDTALMRNLRVLESRGWVEIRVGADRRQRLAALTDAGREAFAAAMPMWERAQREALAALKDEFDALNARLRGLTKRLA